MIRTRRRSLLAGGAAAGTLFASATFATTPPNTSAAKHLVRIVVLSTRADLVSGGEMPYGLGCGGTVVVLLEQGEAARETLEALRRSVEELQSRR